MTDPEQSTKGGEAGQDLKCIGFPVNCCSCSATRSSLQQFIYTVALQNRCNSQKCLLPVTSGCTSIKPGKGPCSCICTNIWKPLQTQRRARNLKKINMVASSATNKMFRSHLQPSPQRQYGGPSSTKNRYYGMNSVPSNQGSYNIKNNNKGSN